MKQELLTCSEIQRYLHAYLDGEFDTREEVEIQQHIHSCPNCQQELRMFQSLKRQMREHHQAGIAPMHLQALVSAEIRNEATGRTRSHWMTNLSVAAMFCVIIGGVSKGVYDRAQQGGHTTEANKVLKVLEGKSSGLVPYLNNVRFSNMTSQVGAAATPLPVVRSFHSRVMSVKSSSPLVRTSFHGQGTLPAATSAQRARNLLHAPRGHFRPVRQDLQPTLLLKDQKPQKSSVHLCTDAVPTGLKAASSSFRSVMPAILTPVCDDQD